MSSTNDSRAIAALLAKSREIQSVEINRDMKPEAITRLLKTVTDHAVKASKTKRVVLISVVLS
jgi:hypothetical protein